jgi:succinyl-diaminopimelate desuccinylase
LPTALTDPLPLAQALLQCASVTPADAGAQDVLAEALSALGFTIHRLPFGETPNLYARLGTEGPHFCFAGHTDVVPPGDGWRHDPFGGVVEDGILYGRGACDMKAAIAAFVAGVAQAKEAGRRGTAPSVLSAGCVSRAKSPISASSASRQTPRRSAISSKSAAAAA